MSARFDIRDSVYVSLKIYWIKATVKIIINSIFVKVKQGKMLNIDTQNPDRPKVHEEITKSKKLLKCERSEHVILEIILRYP